MKTCAHENLQITERGTAFTSHEIRGGQVLSRHSDFGEYTGACSAKCDNCGRSVTFNRYARRLPGWVRRAVELLDGEHDEKIDG